MTMLNMLFLDHHIKNTFHQYERECFIHAKDCARTDEK